MSDFAISEYTLRDIPELSMIWEENFGDSPEFISQFFRLLPEMGSGLCARCQGEIAGGAYMLRGQELCLGGRPLPVGYIYAVAVKEKFRRRGIGGALSAAAAATLRSRGAEIISTLPAEDSLYPWYRAHINTGRILLRRRERVKCAPLMPLKAISAVEYSALREKLLKGRPHLRLSPASMEFEAIVLSDSGGGFFSLGSAAAAAVPQEGRAVIKELICPEGSPAACAASVGAALGCAQAEFFTPGCPGEKYIAADSDIIPDETVWNLSFD